MSITPQYNGQPILRKKHVYYSGSDLILPGYVLCYAHDAEADASDLKLRKGTLVTKPATANIMLFAGIAAKEVQGPGWLEITPPAAGEAIVALTKVNATAQTTALAPANGEWGFGAHTDATLNLPLAAVALETANTSVTAANKLVLFK